MRGTIGVDIGGTKIAFGFVDDTGRILSKRHFSTQVTLGANSIIQHLADQIKLMVQEEGHEVLRIGVGMAGQIDSHQGFVHFAPNLFWHEFHLGQLLQKLTGLPVVITNDVRAATWGEWHFGSGVGERDLVCLFIGSGIGSGIISNGRLLEGASNCAGELGHTIVDLHGPECHCGNTGCLEAIAGGLAIGRQGQECIIENPNAGKKLLELAGGNIENLTGKIVTEAARDGDLLAMEIVDKAVKALTAGVINIVNAFNPKKIILGGGVITGNEYLIPIIESGVYKRALKAATKNLKIVEAFLKDDAGIIGAATFVLKK